MNDKECLLDEFEFSNHICVNAIWNVIETIEMVLDMPKPSTNEGGLSQTLGSKFNNISKK